MENRLSESIRCRANRNLQAILHALAERSQVKVSELLGVSESTVSRTDKGQIADFLAACGLKAVPLQMQCFDPEYVKALKVMAGVGLTAPEPKSLEWDQ